MPLATRCPHCETVFRIQPEHLTLHGGLARCGHCQQVFDAAHSLVAPDPELAPAIVETTPAAAGTPPHPPRVFSATAPQATPAQAADGNFTPGAWDMWAPWLDGGIDPQLRHNSGNTDATPLVPIAAVPAGEVPASEA
ncbi:MJ0042-type zinc finger domain-containing protein, partial [Burkholderia gladioli]